MTATYSRLRRLVMGLALVSAGDAALLIPLWRKGEKLCPAILFATRRDALDPIAAAARSRSA